MSNMKKCILALVEKFSDSLSSSLGILTWRLPDDSNQFLFLKLQSVAQPMKEVYGVSLSRSLSEEDHSIYAR